MSNVLEFLKRKPGLKKLTGFVRLQTELEFKPTERLMYLWLRLLTADQQEEPAVLTWPGDEFLAELLQTKRQHASKTLADLKKKGLVDWDTPKKVVGVTKLTVLNPNSSFPSGRPKAGSPAGEADVAQKSRPSPMTDDDRMMICSSLERMERYLKFDKDTAVAPAITPGDTDHVKPSEMNWTTAEGYTKTDANARSWTIPQFMGYYWHLVCWYRQQYGLELTIPDFGRLAVEISRYLQMNSKESLHTHIRNLVGAFHVVRYLLRHSEHHVVLQERSINNPLCAEKVQAYLHLSPEERQEIFKKAKAWSRGETED